LLTVSYLKKSHIPKRLFLTHKGFSSKQVFGALRLANLSLFVLSKVISQGPRWAQPFLLGLNALLFKKATVLLDWISDLERMVPRLKEIYPHFY